MAIYGENTTDSECKRNKCEKRSPHDCFVLSWFLLGSMTIAHENARLLSIDVIRLRDNPCLPMDIANVCSELIYFSLT